MNYLTILGIMAAFLTTTALLPQTIKIIKTKHAKDISFLMYIAYTSGLALWLIYGILSKDIPIIFSNSIALPLAVAVIFLKMKFG